RGRLAQAGAAKLLNATCIHARSNAVHILDAAQIIEIKILVLCSRKGSISRCAGVMLPSRKSHTSLAATDVRCHGSAGSSVVACATVKRLTAAVIDGVTVLSFGLTGGGDARLTTAAANSVTGASCRVSATARAFFTAAARVLASTAGSSAATV